MKNLICIFIFVLMSIQVIPANATHLLGGIFDQIIKTLDTLGEAIDDDKLYKKDIPVFVSWVKPYNGTIIRKTKIKGGESSINCQMILKGGQNNNSTNLYLCSAKFKNGLHPGHLNIEKHKGCRISWGGAEYEIRNPTNWEYRSVSEGVKHEALWRKVDDDRSLSDAKPTGKEADGTYLYTCRAKLDDGIYPGKIGLHLAGCHIPKAGKEHILYEYEVFVGIMTWQLN